MTMAISTQRGQSFELAFWHEVWQPGDWCGLHHHLGQAYRGCVALEVANGGICVSPPRAIQLRTKPSLRSQDRPTLASDYFLNCFR